MYNIDRFIDSHEVYYEMDLTEIKNGYKYGHWMWFIFPQLKGLGESDLADYYGISGLEEAKEYYNNDYLRKHLIEISKALLRVENKSINYIMGYPDNLKLKSCMTLFELVDPKEEIFKEVLDKYYSGERDDLTIKMVIGGNN